MMVTVYVLQSLFDGTFYVGMSKNLSRRLNEHNNGKSRFTAHSRPWKIIHQESYPDFKSGRIREKYLKSAAGKSYLKKVITIESQGSLPE